MKRIAIRQNLARIDPSKKARPPPTDIPSKSMNYTQ